MPPFLFRGVDRRAGWRARSAPGVFGFDALLSGERVVSCELDSLSMHRAALSNQARCEGTRLFLAMCVYFREHGKLPASLDELVQANILERVPFDPFSSNRFQYSREDQAIWSVGWEGRVSPAAVAGDESDFQNHLWRLDTIK